MTDPHASYALAAVLRSQVFSVVVGNESRVIEVRRARLSKDRDVGEVARLLLQLARDYQASLVTVESSTLAHEAALSAGLQVRIVSVHAAKVALLPALPRVTCEAAYGEVLTRHPCMARFVRDPQRNLALTNRRRTGVLLALALLLAGAGCFPG